MYINYISVTFSKLKKHTRQGCPPDQLHETRWELGGRWRRVGGGGGSKASCLSCPEAFPAPAGRDRRPEEAALPGPPARPSFLYVVHSFICASRKVPCPCEPGPLTDGLKCPLALLPFPLSVMMAEAPPPSSQGGTCLALTPRPPPGVLVLQTSNPRPLRPAARPSRVAWTAGHSFSNTFPKSLGWGP